VRVLIIGGSGLVGRHAIAALAKDHEVIAPRRNELDLASDWRPTDLPSDIDGIVHVAQARRWRQFPQHAAETIAINLTSTAKLLEFAVHAGVRSLVYASTGGVYRPSTTLLDEASPLKTPQECDLYAATKLASEQLIASYGGLLDASVLRLFTVYGDGQDPNSLIPRLERSIAERSPIRLAQPDGPLLSPTQASEVARVIGACLDSPGSRILNVGGGHNQRLRDIAAGIGERIGIPPTFITDPGPASVLAPSRTWKDAIDAIARGGGRS